MGGICSGIEVAITRTIRNRLTVDPVRGFESHPLRHVGASCISLAPTFFKSQSTLIALLLLSKSNPLRWASIWFWAQSRKKIDFTRLLHEERLEPLRL